MIIPYNKRKGQANLKYLKIQGSMRRENAKIEKEKKRRLKKRI